jgi:predicted KAP-like P-loop ATPase
LKPSDLAELHRKLGPRRVVVFIDDLDRADARVIPKALLALRELLDWPNFAFVLAFDKAIVATALGEYSRAYGENAHLFLQKVIDVGFDIPPCTLLQKQRFGEAIFRDLLKRTGKMEGLDSLRTELGVRFSRGPQQAVAAAPAEAPAEPHVLPFAKAA